MNDELKEIVRVLIILNKSVNERVFPGTRLLYLDNILKKFNARIDALNKLLDTLLAMDLDFNDSRVITLLIAVHQNFSQLIMCVDTVRNATGKMVGNYREEWHKVNDGSKS